MAVIQWNADDATESAKHPVKAFRNANREINQK